MNSFHFYKHRFWYFGISLLILVPGLFSLVRYGLKLSIDFTGGTVLELQSADHASHVYKFKELDATGAANLKKEQEKTLGPLTEVRFEQVGPAIGAEQTKNAFLAVAVASLLIIAYVAWSFRAVPKPYSSWKFGVSAVAALLHDVLVVVGIFSILGHFYNVEIDSLFVTAMLTVIGFSVHDTIVVFDRIRENLPKMPSSTFIEVVDFSLTETLVRSLNTSITAALTLLALLIFGGESVRWFIVALLVGIISGTYSSIFNAAQILAVWEEK